MLDPGEPRPAARIGVVIVLLAALGGGLWWWKHRHISDGPATSSVMQPQHGSASSTATQRGTPIEPAKLVVTVSDDKGPLANGRRFSFFRRLMLRSIPWKFSFLSFKWS